MKPSSSLALSRPRPLVVPCQNPVRGIVPTAGSHWSADFGKAAFGTIRLAVTARAVGSLEVRLGEKLTPEGRVDLTPGGCIRALSKSVSVSAGRQTIQLEIPPDERNTGPRAIHMPKELFEVFPFRYAEVMTADGVTVESIERLAVMYPFNDDASSFSCSDDRLNRVWELCKYSIQMTSFCGVYVDGDRERIPYEGDAYINQLCHYGVDAEYELARHSLEYLLFHPTWPTEWILHCVPMAWADYLYTGRTDLLESYYDVLRCKMLLPLAREDGLISTETGLVTSEILADIHLPEPLKDIVDWPPGSFTDGGVGERDNHEMRPINTVVNAFHYWNLVLMNRIATRLGRTDDASFFEQQAAKVSRSIQEKLFDAARGVFVDGEGSEHSSLHANCFPAAFGLVPEAHRASVLQFIQSRGMACSVYGAQFLLEACYQLGAPEYALELMTAEHDRGWINMLNAGSTVTLEAWDIRYKKNLDWNHAWGAAPANIIPRYLVGVRPEQPGCDVIRVEPAPAGLTSMEARVPVPAGAVTVRIDQRDPAHRRVEVESPSPLVIDLNRMLEPGTRIEITPAVVPSSRGVYMNVPPGRYEIRLKK